METTTRDTTLQKIKDAIDSVNSALAQNGNAFLPEFTALRLSNTLCESMQALIRARDIVKEAGQ